MKTLLALILAAGFTATAQTTTPAPAQSACYILTYSANVKGEYKKFLTVACKAEIRAAEVVATNPSTATTTGTPIGIAAQNKSKLTVTYRDSSGKALEGSEGWAKLEKARINAEKKIAVEEARANRPVIEYGGGYGSSYYGNGGQAVTFYGEGGYNKVVYSGR